jgi:hypothetical protein
MQQVPATQRSSATQTVNFDEWAKQWYHGVEKLEADARTGLLVLNGGRLQVLRKQPGHLAEFWRSSKAVDNGQLTMRKHAAAMSNLRSSMRGVTALTTESIIGDADKEATALVRDTTTVAVTGGSVAFPPMLLAAGVRAQLVSAQQQRAKSFDAAVLPAFVPPLQHASSSSSGVIAPHFGLLPAAMTLCDPKLMFSSNAARKRKRAPNMCQECGYFCKLGHYGKLHTEHSKSGAVTKCPARRS